MDPLKQPPRGRPEAKIQKAIIQALEARQWYVNPTHGNACQSGFPDLFCMHQLKGMRWIEVKNPGKWDFTDAQKKWYPRFVACKVPVWILMSAEPAELIKLDGPSNLKWYLERYGLGLR